MAGEGEAESAHAGKLAAVFGPPHLVGTDHRVARSQATQVHPRSREGQTASLRPRKKLRLIVSACRGQWTVIGLGNPPLGAHGPADRRIDPLINLVWRRLGDIDQAAAYQGEARGFDAPPLIAEITARNIENRARLGRDGSTSPDRELPAIGRQLGCIPFDDVGKTGGVSKRRSDPIASAVIARLADIHCDGGTADLAIALQRCDSQLRPAQFQIQNTLRKGHENIGGAGHVKQRAAADSDRSVGVNKLRISAAEDGVVVAIQRFDHLTPLARGDREIPARRSDDRARTEHDIAARDVDPREERQGRADIFVATDQVGQHIRDRAAAEADAAGFAEKKSRFAGGPDRIVVRIGHRIIARVEVETAVERNSGHGTNASILREGSANHREVARRNVDETVVDRTARAVLHLADKNVDAAQRGIGRWMRLDTDLQAGRHNGLARRRLNRALVADIGADEHDTSAAAFGIDRRAD